MSSHHIVREKQEPALLVLSLEGFDDEQLGQLLEWSPTLLVTPLVAEQLNAFGIKVDWIIADDIDNELQSDVKLLPTNGKPENIAAIDHLVDKGYPSVNIVTDQFDLAQYQPYVNKINLVVFYQQQKIYSVESGFSKWKPAGELIKIVSPAKNLITKGLEETGKNTYITVADGFFSLYFDGVAVFMAESL
ncbi:thiamine pyrophosphokinase [Mucilaginibacter sp. dw_454]|uniref:thiamine pyrophosphokinase n=1 Tax=Mucilaginibacter sp. dw_454 TaxID=2720079 RepID=UPI001BD30B6B|nr:thiamine pyrophosphokinase [Mucilaginibacter sp. dw_454]